VYICKMNYFTLYDIAEKPVVDRAIVSKKYIELQKAFHPDFFTNETEANKENALAQSAAINKAYAIFSNKEKTIEYFLQLKEVIIADEKFQLPADFLMEIMELNEGFDEAKNIESEINTFEQNLFESVKPFLIPENDSLLDEKALQELKLYYYKKKYLQRILDRLDD
jgi:molecular chaperone HscB